MHFNSASECCLLWGKHPSTHPTHLNTPFLFNRVSSGVQNVYAALATLFDKVVSSTVMVFFAVGRTGVIWIPLGLMPSIVYKVVPICLLYLYKQT